MRLTEYCQIVVTISLRLYLKASYVDDVRVNISSNLSVVSGLLLSDRQ